MSDAETRPDGDPAPEEFAVYVPPRRTASSSAPVLACMMLAVGEIIEPQNTHVELTVEATELIRQERLGLDFGDLPALD